MVLVKSMLAGLMAVGASMPAVSTVDDPLGWVESPTGLSSPAVLNQVSAAQDALWAVGERVDPYPHQLLHPLALRYDGAGWTETSQPVDIGRLDDVAVIAADNVWAVGTDETNFPEFRPIIQRWDGSGWQLVPAPALPAGTYGTFTTVGAADPPTARDDVWVAGDTQDLTGDTVHRAVYRYTDGVWHSITNVGLERFGYIRKIVPVGDDDVWLAGDRSGIAHYNGSRWTQIGLAGGAANISILDLNVRAQNDIWAAGFRSDAQHRRLPLVLHYDGGRWTEVPTPAGEAEPYEIEVLNGQTVVVGWQADPDEPTGFFYIPYVLTLRDGQFIRSQNPPGSGGLDGAAVYRGQIWTVGVAAMTDENNYYPYIAFTTMR
jgi:hypothetical protein